ncbi:VCBS repeat-containing protein [candidate division KSB1 bacterium]|nr:VCBS repeat-containing protein [candidate division KSB1 bacterium]
MKKSKINLIFYLTVLCYMTSIQAQVQFSEQKVIVSHSTSTYGATSVYSADLDGDGDMDVLSASERDNKIAWYANDGSGGFGA